MATPYDVRKLSDASPEETEPILVNKLCRICLIHGDHWTFQCIHYQASFLENSGISVTLRTQCDTSNSLTSDVGSDSSLKELQTKSINDTETTFQQRAEERLDGQNIFWI